MTIRERAATQTGYEDFLASKRIVAPATGHDVSADGVHPSLFGFQAALVRWAVRKGRCALFTATGTGKTRMAVEWARLVGERTLIVAPLGVARQTVQEAMQIAVDVRYARSQADATDGITITNYEMVERFDPAAFGAVVLDESSILKSISGKSRARLTEMFGATPYRLCCTATPAPNDIAEIANHAEFLGIMRRVDMLASFFVHDDNGWRLKGHASEAFYRWLASWAMAVRLPSDIGYPDDGYILPPLAVEPVWVEADYVPEGQLFFTDLHGITDRMRVRQGTVADRVAAAARLVNGSHGLCDSTGKYGKLAACGRKNTPSADAPSITLMPKSGRAGVPSHAARKRTRTTCVPTTLPIKSDGPSAARRTPMNATAVAVNATPLIPSMLRSSERLRVRATKLKGVKRACGPRLAWTVLHGMPYWHSRVEGARSAALPQAMRSNVTSTSTTATSQGRSADCCARPAISPSVSSRTIPPSLNVPSPISPPPGPREPWVIWCGLDAEQRALEKAFGDRAVSVYGTLSPDEKEARLASWLRGDQPILLSKPRVAGFGLNLQRCARMVFVGLGDSWEQYYQCIRRCWRFGQSRPVQVYVVLSTHEDVVYRNVMRKEDEAAAMSENLVAHVREMERVELAAGDGGVPPAARDEANGEGWRVLLGDSVERMAELADNSVDLTVSSPPFQHLYVYNPTERDVGNCRTSEEFRQHFAFVVDHLLRVTKPGRLAAIHVQQIAAMLERDGYIGLKDFRGDVIRLFSDHGWIYHGEVCVDRDPQAQAIRTHSKGLLFVQLRKDAAWMRPALPDHILLFRKPGDNAVPVQPAVSNEEWIQWAHPVWYDVRESHTLNGHPARENDDERHICPLQLDTIARCIRLWSNPGETCFDPFAGVGSTLFQAITLGRRGLGCELKRSYYETATRYLREAEATRHQPTLFDGLEPLPAPASAAGQTEGAAR